MEAADATESVAIPEVSEKVSALLTTQPYVINLGLKSFSEAIRETGGKAVQFDWRPAAGGDVRLQKVLYFLNNYQTK